jgi:hypothetical protein
MHYACRDDGQLNFIKTTTLWAKLFFFEILFLTKYIFQPIVIFSDFFSNWDIRIILPNLYFLLLDAHNLLVELNLTEIPNPRWKENDLHFSSLFGCTWYLLLESKGGTQF